MKNSNNLLQKNMGGQKNQLDSISEGNSSEENESWKLDLTYHGINVTRLLLGFCTAIANQMYSAKKVVKGLCFFWPLSHVQNWLVHVTSPLVFIRNWRLFFKKLGEVDSELCHVRAEMARAFVKVGSIRGAGGAHLPLLPDLPATEELYRGKTEGEEKELLSLTQFYPSSLSFLPLQGDFGGSRKQQTV